MATEAVGALRRYSTLHPEDRELEGLIHELRQRSREFEVRWASHDVACIIDTEKISLNHPTTGQVELPYERLTFLHDQGLTMFVHLLEAGKPPARRIQKFVAAMMCATRDPARRGRA